MKTEQRQQQRASHGLGDKPNGEDENVGTTLPVRLKSLGADFLVLSAGVLLLCGLVSCVVFLFRMGNVGKSVVSAVSSCSAVFTAAAWPILIAVLVVLYRRHVVEALKELPCFIKAYAAAELQDKLSVASSNGDDDQDAGVVGAGCRDGRADEANSEIAKASAKGESRDGDGARRPKRGRGGANDAFVEGALAAIQDEYGKFVHRGAYLFSYRDYCFDGAIVDEDCIMGIAVSRGDVDDDRRRLDRIGRFYQSISSRDRKCFKLVYCIPLGQDARVAALREHCRRQGFNFSVIFRPCANGKLQQA